MISSAIENELHEQFVRLPFERQRQVLEYVRALAMERPHGVAGKSLLRFAGTITADDLVLMSAQINDGSLISRDGHLNEVDSIELEVW